ncbi:MAG TPA: MATE family efflux transporter [Anaeromyxobacteraceae bacterium]|nr:MATE family efflux transporter [Anaeromyxobacteraceae bacterium]
MNAEWVASPSGQGPRGWRARLRALLVLAWPIVVSRGSQVVVSIADAIMVAHLGAAALAATTAGAANAFAFFIFPMGITFIVSSFSSQLFGMGDLAAARRHGWYGLAIAVAAEGVVLLVLPLVTPAIGLFGYAPEVRVQMAGYVVVRLLSTGAVVGLEALGHYFGGLGNTRYQMRASLVAMALTVVGNWLFIDGHLGAPALGVRGAALSNTLSTSVAFIGLLVVFLWEGYRRGAGPLRRAELLRVLRFGLPSGLTWFFEFAAYVFFVDVVVAGLGTTSLVALMTVIQVNSVAFMPTFGLASGGAILVGHAIGTGRKDWVGALVWLTFVVAAVWQSLVALVYLAAPNVVLSIFARDPETAAAILTAGRRMLSLSASWQLFDAAANVLGEALRAAGDTRFTMWARVVISWIIWAPGSWISVRVLGGGARVAVAWLVIYLAALALVLFLRFQSGAWRRIALVEPAVG